MLARMSTAGLSTTAGCANLGFDIQRRMGEAVAYASRQRRRGDPGRTEALVSTDPGGPLAYLVRIGDAS